MLSDTFYCMFIDFCQSPHLMKSIVSKFFNLKVVYIKLQIHQQLYALFSTIEAMLSGEKLPEGVEVKANKKLVLEFVKVRDILLHHDLP